MARGRGYFALGFAFNASSSALLKQAACRSLALSAAILLHSSCVFCGVLAIIVGYHSTTYHSAGFECAGLFHSHRAKMIAAPTARTVQSLSFMHFLPSTRRCRGRERQYEHRPPS